MCTNLTTTGTGNPANLPVISTTGSLSALSTTYGTVSSSGTFNVSGTDITAGILVTPPTGFEVSLDNTTFAPTVTVGAAGTIASTPVFIRLSSLTAAGSYSGNAVLSSSGAAGVNVATVSSKVNKATLTVTANHATKVYGAFNPALGVTYTGFVNGDTNASLTTGPAASTTAIIGSAVGTYPITAHGAASANYRISYTAGTLTVTQATLTIAISNATKVYGAVNPALGVTYTGFVNGDTKASLTQPTVITTSVTGSPAGTYPIMVIGAASANYHISYTEGTLTVTRATLTVAANNATKVYGAVNPALGVTYTGFVNGDASASLTTRPAVSTTAIIGSGVGTYPITASGAASPNYRISYTAGTLTVTQATLTIAANNATKVYGAFNPTLGVTYTGFVNGDTNASLTTRPWVGTTAIIGSAAGTYPITASGAASANYSISYTVGTLTVTGPH
jgi:hypothetical protein